MIAFAYIILIVAFGDALARCFFFYESWNHRLATAFIVGLLGATWSTYLVALVFGDRSQPLLMANVVVGAIMLLTVGLALRGSRLRRPNTGHLWRVLRGEGWDWVVLAGAAVLAAWMMTTTFSYVGGELRMTFKVWGDVGPNTAIAQSLAFGHNYPTEYPLFPGPPIRQHFLYYAQAGNLTFLGADPALASNILSVLSVVSLLALVMALGRRLFASRAAGRLGALLFFFHGALSFVPFLASFDSVDAAVAGVLNLDHFLRSGFPYRGEDWALWTQNVFLNQRHLASALAVLLVVLLFVVDRQGQLPEYGPGAISMAHRLRRARMTLGSIVRAPHAPVVSGFRDPALLGFAACGVLLGALPLWNGAIFVASAVIMATLLLFYGHRVQMAVTGVVASLIALPQLALLLMGGEEQELPAIRIGYVVDDPTVERVAAYVLFLFGPKLALIAAALTMSRARHWRLLLGMTSVVVLAFTVQLTVDIVANHKFFNAWLVVANVFAAYGLVLLWRTGTGAGFPVRWLLLQRATAGLLLLAIVVGGVIDLFPIKNDYRRGYRLGADRLYTWLQDETQPRDVFLSELYVVHPILLAGRRVYLGWPVYAWAAGYDVAARIVLYERMLQVEDLGELLGLLEAHRIAYVAIDDGLRSGRTVANLNEAVFQENFETVFSDVEGRYGNLTIYRVPQ